MHKRQQCKWRVHILEDETENKDISIKIDNSRIRYTNSEIDITIIEIKEADNINDYLELDDIIINDILNNDNKTYNFWYETIYIIQYPKGELSVSYGTLDAINEDKKYNFNHKCKAEIGSSGSPILNLNNKVIGILKDNFNEGTFLNYPIKEFIKLTYMKINSKTFTWIIAIN
jgi:V8-like Glu-specific endopeptidase